MQSQSVSPPPSKKEAREQALPVAELHTLRSASNSPAAPPPAAAPEVQPSSNGAAPHTAHKQKQAGGVSRIPHAPSAAAASSPSAAGTSLTSAAAASARKTAAAAAAGADAGAAPTANGSTSTGAAAFKPSKAMQAQDLRSATMGPDSSDWSDNSSDSSSSNSSSAGSSATAEAAGSAAAAVGAAGSSTRHGSKAQSNGSQHQEQQQGSRKPHTEHQQQHQQQHSTVDPLQDPLQQQQQHQHHAVSTRLEQQQQQQQQLQGGQQGHPQQQQQELHSSNGGPGPPEADAAAGCVAAAAVTGAAGAAAAQNGTSGSSNSSSASAAAVAGATTAAGPADASLVANSSEAAAAAAAANDSSSMVRQRMSADPDYELPQGKLTETQVLLAHGSKLRLDRYGFILGESDMAGRTAGPATAAAVRRQRSASQVRREQRHVAKWRHMLGASAGDFEAYCAVKLSKVKRRVRKGIPDEFRGYVWQLLSGGHALMRSHPGMYARLLSHQPDSVDLEIMRDLNRTFPNHVFFHQRQGPGQQSLFHVLRAYSALDRQVGYVQGMGFVSAILLMYMSEEAAFWTLVALLKGTASQPPLEGLYQAGMPLLQQCLFQLHELLKQEHPRLGLHLEQEGVVPSMYCTHWFNTLFAYSLPFEQLLRVWDVFLLEGMKVVFRVGIALLASAQDQLCAMPFERLVAALNGRKFPILNKHPDSLMKAALRIPVSRQLEQLRERFLTLQAETQAAAAAEAEAAGNGSGGHTAAGRTGGLLMGQQSGAAGGSSSSGAAAQGSSSPVLLLGGRGRSASGQQHTSKSSAAHARQQLIAGFAPVPMGPDS